MKPHLTVSLTVLTAYVLFQDGGPSCGEATIELGVSVTDQQAENWINKTLAGVLQDKEIDLPDRDTETIREAYIDACDEGKVPSATWGIQARTITFISGNVPVVDLDGPAVDRIAAHLTPDQ